MIPKVTKHLLSNPVFTCIVLAACMEIAVVAGFAAFLGKYLEQQFNLTTTSANQLLGPYPEQNVTHVCSRIFAHIPVQLTCLRSTLWFQV